jgi:hypothetical protein
MIGFTSERDGNSEIYVMRANGTGQTRLTDDQAFDFQPAWSPDGREIATSDREGALEIFKMKKDGSIAHGRHAGTGSVRQRTGRQRRDLPDECRRDGAEAADRRPG